MREQDKHQQLRIGLVSPEQILSWSERILPNGERVGEVTTDLTLDYETYEPESDGLFCQKIFGPKKRGVCACVKSRVIENEEEDHESNFCSQCGVELVVDSRIRRYRMGYIKLACPVVHIWYFKRRPSYIADLLDKTRKELEDLVYCDVCITRSIANKPTSLRFQGSFKYEDQYWPEIIAYYLSCDFGLFQEREIATGGKAIRDQLAGLDLKIILDRSYMEWKRLDEIISILFTGTTKEDVVFDEELKKMYDKLNEQELQKIRRRKDLLVRRMKLAKYFLQANIEPQWMVLSLLPVLPPDLRPMVQIDEIGLISSDLNELYQTVIRRNNLLIEFIEDRNDVFAIPDLLTDQKRLVQEAVDALLDNSIGGQPMKDSHDRPYKSFSDFIQGKEGRFRENLLGKRVDYSGRSVIVVGPLLSLYQCGLPREIAIELFQAFLLRDIVERQIAPTLRAAKSLIQDRRPIIWNVLKQIMQRHPILLNRAPTLHRLGIQAFIPILIEERAIRLHPLVCTGFNADFDGDQMAVHVPLSTEAQVEARLLMFSHLNLISPTIGDPICVPTQDMLLGLYRSTLQKNQGIYENRYHPDNSKNKIVSPSFSSYDDALRAYEQKRIDLDSPLWLRWGRDIDIPIINSVNREVPIEVQYESIGTFYEIHEHFRIKKGRMGEIRNKYIRTTVGRTRFNREIEEAIKGLWAYDIRQKMSLLRI
uniref:DNA-directed RNA polymerase subunit beta' n=3 Tax=Cephalotaxus TaxID=50178 RepID=A0A8E4WUV3_9CONI|nr:RNA polymerase beta' subunit [Cephalotaxus fortunei var. alpina]YP_010137999.1 RNA polymerase beta' subunit [Cephalotaxus fortunei]YP_010138245.1 RNA polymerase beta' subunit [Cephalotaxus mannii]QPO89611.1 RNA polymerase beta' subunit [Cephalotaxus fortunei var. alpina]QPO89693.1 RNA polymerase beta' subunit [Cephalotaxus fortunei]QPO90021.1 RNA polymerase beta' subunit [Cephalotaxus mannii]UPV70846.1 RNA polymerase beta' subunit [Cephalotaxus mannii]UPV70928.1 RNA polymerase beta' subun